jgi:hypothetical protein
MIAYVPEESICCVGVFPRFLVLLNGLVERLLFAGLNARFGTKRVRVVSVGRGLLGCEL